MNCFVCDTPVQGKKIGIKFNQVPMGSKFFRTCFNCYQLCDRIASNPNMNFKDLPEGPLKKLLKEAWDEGLEVSKNEN